MILNFVYSVGQFFAFVVCKKWTYPVIDRYSRTTDQIELHIQEEDEKMGISRRLSLQNVGGYVMMVLIVGFEVLLYLRLQVWLVLLEHTTSLHIS